MRDRADWHSFIGTMTLFRVMMRHHELIGLTRFGIGSNFLAVRMRNQKQIELSPDPAS
jgi:hypothetical protein